MAHFYAVWDAYFGDLLWYFHFTENNLTDEDRPLFGWFLWKKKPKIDEICCCFISDFSLTNSEIDVIGHCVNSGQPEFFVKLGEDIQFLHLKHKCSDGFCLGFPCSFCSAELFEPCLGFFIPLYKPIVPGGVTDFAFRPVEHFWWLFLLQHWQRILQNNLFLRPVVHTLC